MKRLQHVVYSDGLALAASMYLPDDIPRSGRLPLVLACSGFTGLNRVHPARFARQLTARGYACFGFDYRGHGQSEGARRRVLLEEQVRDIRSAFSVASNSDYVDPDNVFMLGWAMGGGLVLDAARELDGIRGLIAINGLYDGPDFQLAHRGVDGLAEFRRRISCERFRRASTGIAEYVDPFDIYPLDDVTRGYVSSSLEPVEGYDITAYSFEFAESLMRWSVPATLSTVVAPLFIAHGDRNALHPPRQVEELRRYYQGEIEVHWLRSAGHTEWMEDDNPIFLSLCERLSQWLDRHRLTM